MTSGMMTVIYPVKDIASAKELYSSLLGVAPERCLVFEDGQPGIVAAERAGMRTVLVKRESPYG